MGQLRLPLQPRSQDKRVERFILDPFHEIPAVSPETRGSGLRIRARSPLSLASERRKKSNGIRNNGPLQPEAAAIRSTATNGDGGRRRSLHDVIVGADLIRLVMAAARQPAEI
jgi:hypothetical protein